MASFYVRENEIVKDRQGKRWLKFGLWIKLTNLEGAKSAITGAEGRRRRIRFPDLLKLFASLHGTYSQPPGKRKGLFLGRV